MRFQKCEDAAPLVIRAMVGMVFLSEGIQKYLFAEAMGAGRFAKLGIPMPQFFGPFVGAVEISCGILILLGWKARLCSIPLMAVILVAIAATKVPMFLEKGFGPPHTRDAPTFLCSWA